MWDTESTVHRAQALAAFTASFLVPSAVEVPVTSTSSAETTGALTPGVTSTLTRTYAPRASEPVCQPLPVTEAVMAALMA